MITNAFEIQNAGRILGYDYDQPERIKGMSKSAALKYFGIENLTSEQKDEWDKNIKSQLNDIEDDDGWSDAEEVNSDISIVSYNSEGDEA